MWPLGPSPFVTVDAYYYCRSLTDPHGERGPVERRDQLLNCRDTASQNDSLLLEFLRLAWLLFGPILMATSTMMIVVDGSGWATWTDLCFLLAVVVMIGGRWVSFLCGDLNDENGHPTTSLPFMQRYTLRWIPSALIVWVAANVVGNHLLS